MADLVDTAQRASYQLCSTASSKLRRMTRTSGLASENIVSRVALVRSLQDPLPDDVRLDAVVTGGKEIKGVTLLGKRRPATLLVALICRHAKQPVDSDQLRALVTFHWERGVTALARETAGTNVLDWLAKRVVTPASTTNKMGRDEMARAIGRQYGGWPLEVRRMVVNAGRLELGRSLEIARRLAGAAEQKRAGARMSEAIALEFLRDEWKYNRLGLGPDDRQLLDRLRASGADGLAQSALSVDERNALPFLIRLALVEQISTNIRLTPDTQRCGDELWSLR